MDPLRLSIALGPLAVYLLLLGMINLSRRPFVTTGARDMSALGIAISGLVIVGPMELFLPGAAAWPPVWLVWLLCLVLYSLCVTLVVMLLRPRIVIYNISAERLRPILADVVAGLDKEARWAGDCLVLPSMGVQLHVEPMGPFKNAQLVGAGPQQNLAGWRKLELTLARVLRENASTRNAYGLVLLVVGVLAVGVITFLMVRDTQSIAHGLREMLRL
jgi:hypothetical protein